MRKLFIVAAILKMGLASGQTNSIYSFQVDSIAGNHVIDFSAFQGKKILIINGASQDSTSWQYAQIKQLSNQYRDSLAVVVIPSNSFNTENSGEAAMLSFYTQQGENRFPVTEKLTVSGNGIHPLYQWLTQKSKNGVLDSEVRRPFQKYLISKSGRLLGVFSGRMKPFDQPLIQAITTASN